MSFAHTFFVGFFLTLSLGLSVCLSVSLSLSLSLFCSNWGCPHAIAMQLSVKPPFRSCLANWSKEMQRGSCVHYVLGEMNLKSFLML